MQTPRAATGATAITSALRRRLVRPWAQPAGLLGRVAAWEMAHGKAALDDRVAALLAPEPGDRILEVGFGPGTTLARLAPLVPAGGVVGVDPSAVMHRQAARRNRAAIAAGRVELHVARAERLPFADDTFDKALTLHPLGHWTAPEAGLAELRRVLRPGGVLLVGLRAGTGDAVAAARDAIARAGFERRPVAAEPVPGESTLLLARVPA